MNVAFLVIFGDGNYDIATRFVRFSLNGINPIGLTLEENGPIVAYRWSDGGGYNADWRYSIVDPREDEWEFESSGASSVGRIEPLYIAR